MNLYWLVRNSIDFCWILPFISVLKERLSIDYIYVDLTIFKGDREAVELNLKSLLLGSFSVCSTVDNNFFKSNSIRFAVFEWGTGSPVGFHRFLRFISNVDSQENYRRKVIASLKKYDNVVKIALPHGYNVKLNHVTKRGIKSHLVSPLGLGRDRNFFDIYGYDTYFHRDKMISDGIKSSRLIKVPPLFPLLQKDSVKKSKTEKELFIMPKLRNKINHDKLIEFLKSIQGDNLFISLHPREVDVQKVFLQTTNIKFNSDFVILGNSPVSVLSSFRTVYDVGSSVGLFAAIAGCNYYVPLNLSNNNTIYEIGGIDNRSDLMCYSDDYLLSFLKFFHNENCCEFELDTFIGRLSHKLKK